MLATIFTGIGSLFLTLIGYFYNSWRTTVKENRKVYLTYIWYLRMNQQLLTQMQNGSLALEFGSTKLQTLEPYSIRYIPVLDDSLSKDLLHYNLLILNLSARGGLTAKEIDETIFYSNCCLEKLHGQLSFVDNVIGKLSVSSFLCYLSFPSIINYIVKTYLSAPHCDVLKKDKSN